MLSPYAGATAWLETVAPVVPGEDITLGLMIWDSGDHSLDSLVLLDDLSWILAASAVIFEEGLESGNLDAWRP